MVGTIVLLGIIVMLMLLILSIFYLRPSEVSVSDKAFDSKYRGKRAQLRRGGVFRQRQRLIRADRRDFPKGDGERLRRAR